jgi:hypothetical protein
MPDGAQPCCGSKRFRNARNLSLVPDNLIPPHHPINLEITSRLGQAVMSSSVF